MQTIGLFAALLLRTGSTACPPSDKKDSLLIEATPYYQQATAMTEAKMEQIDSLQKVRRVQNTPELASRIATPDSLKEAFKAWEEKLR